MNHHADAGPAAFNTARMTWADLPARVRERVAELAGAEVAGARATTSGFSPGFAGVVSLVDGRRVFVKATGEAEHPWSIDIARAEVEVNAALPHHLPAPRLLWSDVGAWVLAGFEVIDGVAPELPWRQSELAAVFDAFTSLAVAQPLPGHRLRPIAEAHPDTFSMWERFAERPQEEREAAAARGGQWGEWALRHLSTLAAWERDSAAACTGGSLVHGDLRADNVLLDTHGKVWMVDWPHVSMGAQWLDLAFMLPSVAMQGGGPAHDHFRSHPLGVDVEHDAIRAAVTAIAGYFLLNSWEDAPAQIPTVRAFQAGQALPAIAWLQALEPRLV